MTNALTKITSQLKIKWLKQFFN